MTITLGVVADDFTGATDVANNLVRAGLRVVQTIGVPAPDAEPVGGVDALVVALKSRTAPVDEAVAQSLAAGRWLRGQGARQLYFKVCSTFDSTPRGNIGPVTEALMALTGAAFVPVTPAFPENGRTVFKGHLFVGDLLLSDSPMRQHPLTPMTDANLLRVLQPQLAHERVGLIEHVVVTQGAEAIAQRAQALAGAGQRIAIVDAVDDAALHHLAAACAEWPLVVAGSGLALGLPRRWGFVPRAEAAALPPPQGHAAIVSGSCSAASNAQVADFIAAGGAAYAVDALRVAAGHDVAAEAIAWAAPRLGRAPVLIYATAAPEVVRAVQQRLGAEHAGALIERTLAAVAAGLVRQGVRRLVVAGGETSGACVQALGVRQLRIGPQIDPGVPWCHAAHTAHGALHLALKSGNFGGVDFFRRAFEQLEALA
jgi:3-dehydrotetronate 4-kinase